MQLTSTCDLSNIYHIALLIFNMVSEPNFVLGIKQTSLASKEDSLLLPRCYISDLSSKLNHSPIRSVHIKPSLVETEPTDVLLGLPREKPRNPINQKLAMRRHTSQLAPENLPRAASDA